MAIVNPCSTEYSELADTVLNYFESRFGDGSEGSFFNTDVIRGERRIRVGCRADIYIAAACDPRTKSLNCISSQDKLNIFNELTKQVSAEIQKRREEALNLGGNLEEQSPSPPTESQTSEDIFTYFFTTTNISASVDADFAAAGSPIPSMQIAEF